MGVEHYRSRKQNTRTHSRGVESAGKQSDTEVQSANNWMSIMKLYQKTQTRRGNGGETMQRARESQKYT